jgi:hypothetical protein
MGEDTFFDILGEFRGKKAPVTFYGLDENSIPEPTKEDLKWEKRFAKIAQKKDMHKVRDILHCALVTSNIWRIKAGLEIQAAYPDKDFLEAGSPESLYRSVWEADPVITEMYINTYRPTVMSCNEIDPSLFDRLSMKTRKDWIKSGCGEFINPLLTATIKENNANLDDIKILLDHRDIDFNYEHCTLLREAIRQDYAKVIVPILEKKPDLLDVYSISIMQIALEQENTNTLKILIDKGLDIFANNEFAFSTAKEQGKLEHLKILEQAKLDKIAKEGLTAPRKSIDGWVALSETFVECTRPRSPDGSQRKYEFDFDSGYMAYAYRQEDNFIPFALKPLAEVHNENPQLIEKAVEALTALGCPAPDLTKIFNKPAAKIKSIYELTAPPKTSEATPTPDKPVYKGRPNAR